jgi:hypothetical protein
MPSDLEVCCGWGTDPCRPPPLVLSVSFSGHAELAAVGSVSSEQVVRRPPAALSVASLASYPLLRFLRSHHPSAHPIPSDCELRPGSLSRPIIRTNRLRTTAIPPDSAETPALGTSDRHAVSPLALGRVGPSRGRGLGIGAEACVCSNSASEGNAGVKPRRCEWVDAKADRSAVRRVGAEEAAVDEQEKTGR